MILFLVLIPSIQYRYHFIEVSPLFGSFHRAELPKFLWMDWFSGEFQHKFDKGLEQNIGLRNFFVRLNNQINYSFFNFATAKNVIVGKNGYLFEEGYINAYLGRDCIDSNLVKVKLAKAEFVQRELEKKGKHLLVILAPGKASFYPEYIPDKYHPENKKLSNYDLYNKYLVRSKLNYIDFNGYFIKLKNQTPYPLYPKQGTHWSTYGATLAMDSILKYIRKHFNYALPQVRIKEIEQSDEWRDSDYDIGSGMNILFPMKNDKLAYPKTEFENDPKLKRPRVLVTGDSYYWTLVRLGLNSNCFKEHEFWYYNEVVHVDGAGEKPAVRSDIANAILTKDIIIIIQTESYYHDLGMGFVECAYEQLKNKRYGI